MHFFLPIFPLPTFFEAPSRGVDSILNISISCLHGLFCFVNTLKNMLLLRNLTYFWGWNSEKSLNDLEYINTLILTYLLYWVANIFSYILHSNYRDTDFLIGVSLHAPCTFLHMLWITLIRSITLIWLYVNVLVFRTKQLRNLITIQLV